MYTRRPIFRINGSICKLRITHIKSFCSLSCNCCLRWLSSRTSLLRNLFCISKANALSCKASFSLSSIGLVWLATSTNSRNSNRSLSKEMPLEVNCFLTPVGPLAMPGESQEAATAWVSSNSWRLLESSTTFSSLAWNENKINFESSYL